MFSVIVLLSLAAAAFGSSSSESSETVLDRLDLKNFKAFESQRTDTSTSSSDESSDASRVARAVEAALKEAELAERLAPARTGLRFRPNASGLFRLRVSTVNRALTCAAFSCRAITPLAAAAELEGVAVTVTLVGGATKTAVFDASGEAVNNDDIIGAFRVTAPSVAPLTLQLTTLNNEFGLNVTSIKFTAGGRVSFSPLTNAFWDEETGVAVSDDTLKATIGGAQIGCDATFDTVEERGNTEFTVAAIGDATVLADSTLVSNTTGAELTLTFGVDAFVIDGAAANIGNLVPLTSLPCASRGAVTYDEILVATVGPSEVAQLVDHPLIYNEARAQASAATVSFDNLVRELQQAAGRTQLVLRDIMLDRSAFTILSHTSKYTPCFRALPNDGDQLHVLIGMRSTTGTDGIVQAIATIADEGTDAGLLTDDVDNVLAFRATDAADLTLGAAAAGVQFDVRELAFSTLGQTFTATDFSDFVGPDIFKGTFQRPYAELPSDVSVALEECPVHSYFA